MAHRPALTDFVLAWDEVLKDYYIYHEPTGEALYGAGQDGDVTGLDRTQASWRQPNEPCTVVQGVVPFCGGDQSQWQRAAAGGPTLSAAEANETWEKLFDESSHFFYFNERETGLTQWTCPEGVIPNDMPCANMEHTVHSTELRSVDWTSGWANDGAPDGPGGGGEAIAFPELPASLASADGTMVRARDRSVARFPALPEDDGGSKQLMRQGSGVSSPGDSASGRCFSQGSSRQGSSRTGRSKTAVIGRSKRMDWDLSLKNRGGGGRFDEVIGGMIRLNSRQRHNDTVARLSRQRQRPQTTLPWASHRGHHMEPLRYLDAGSLLDGPFYRRTGRGKRSESAVNALRPRNDPKFRVKQSQKLRNRKVFIHPRDFNFEEWGVGTTVEFFDGFKEGSCQAEPMLVTRAAFEAGAVGIEQVMNENSYNAQVIVFGLMQFAKLPLEETEEGLVNPGAEKAMGWAMRAMVQFKKNESVQAYALSLLVQLTDNYASRKALHEQHDWVGRTILAMQHLRTCEIEVTAMTEEGEVKNVFTEPTRHAQDTCIHACRLFANMACDPSLRETAAEDGVPVVIQSMNFCPQNALVHMSACKALYNFVYRCEKAHILAEQDGVLELVEAIPGNFPGDHELVALAERAMVALRPEGWRALNEQTPARRAEEGPS